MMPVKALVLRLAPRVRWLRTAQALPAPVLRELLALDHFRGATVAAGGQGLDRMVEDIAIMRLTESDVVRHALVQRIIKAYEVDEERRNKKKP